MTYQDKLKQHLATYKQQTLAIKNPGTFLYKGIQVQHEHILPLAQAYRNLFEEAEQAAHTFFTNNPGKRHKYFHHLNSSQAFAFNLFFPYFDGGGEAACALLRALGQQSALDKWEVEVVPAPHEGSNVDVWWTTRDDVQTFCEVKLSEAQVGRAANDVRHRDKLKNIYFPRLNGHLEPARLKEPAFFNAYQFNRNVWHMVGSNLGRLIFLLPRSNSILWKQLEALLSGVMPQTRPRISVVAIEDVLAKLSSDKQCPQGLRKYAKKLEQKYVI